MQQLQVKLIIAIDGYSSCGKSTFAKAIAKKLGYIYIDSGAMYRAVTLFSLQNNIIQNNIIDEKKLVSQLNNILIKFKYTPEINKTETHLNKKNVEDEIRSIEVSNHVSNISKIKMVREKMVLLQREIGKNKGIVMDGRDIGTTVFPDADIKIFMTADIKIRTERRYLELKEKGEAVDFHKIMENIKSRDCIDEGRKESPLRKAKDAILLDNTHITPIEQLDWVFHIINDKFLQKKH